MFRAPLARPSTGCPAHGLRSEVYERNLPYFARCYVESPNDAAGALLVRGKVEVGGIGECRFGQSGSVAWASSCCVTRSTTEFPNMPMPAGELPQHRVVERLVADDHYVAGRCVS